MMAAPSEDSNVFQPIGVDPWEGGPPVPPRYHPRADDGLMPTMRHGGHPDKRGYRESPGEPGGQGKRLVSLRGQSARCRRCANVSVADGGAQGSKTRPAGVLSRPMVLPVPAG